MDARTTFRNALGLGLGRKEGRALTPTQLWGKDILTSPVSKTGEVVTDESALKVTAVWGSVRIITDGLSTMPVDTFQRVDGTRRPFRPRPTWIDAPNPALRLSWADLLSQVLISLLLRGNAYVLTGRDSEGAVVALEVVDPDAVTVRLASDGSVEYRLLGRVLNPTKVLHIRGLSRPGSLVGMDPISYASESVGTALAAQSWGASFFGKGSMPSGVVEVPGQMSPEGVRILREAWRNLHSGAENAGRVGVLTEGAKFAAVSLSPEQSQFLDTRRFTVSDIARIFGVPPHLLADASNSTSWGSGLAEQNVAYVQHTLRPWAERVETAFTWLLNSEGVIQGRPTRGAFVKINLEGLQRGSYAQRFETYERALTAGIYTLDEVRAMEDLPPLPSPSAPPPASPGSTDPAGTTDS